MSRLKELTQDQKNEIIVLYKTTYSVSEVMRTLGFSSYRRHIEKILKIEGIYQGCGGLSAQYKQKKIQKTVLEKYGVINVGQLPGFGWKNNDIGRTSFVFLKELKTYNDKVDMFTKENRKNVIIPQYCYYTGIGFIDSSVKNVDVNPNDNLKRSLDHKLSKWIGFMYNISPEVIGSESNLVYCLKYCNTIKNQMDEATFLPFAQIIRERLINEGFEHN